MIWNFKVMEIHEHSLSNHLQKMFLHVIYKEQFLNIYNFSSLYLPPSANAENMFSKGVMVKTLQARWKLVKVASLTLMQVDASSIEKDLFCNSWQGGKKICLKNWHFYISWQGGWHAKNNSLKNSQQGGVVFQKITRLL